MTITKVRVRRYIWKYRLLRVFVDTRKGLIIRGEIKGRMQLGRIAVVGDGGLLGEIVSEELSRRGVVQRVADIQDLTGNEHESGPNIVATWAELDAISDIRRALRQSLPLEADPLIVVLSQTDPHIYFTRLRALHVERRRLGFNDLLNEIADRLAAGPTTAVPVRAGSV